MEGLLGCFLSKRGVLSEAAGTCEGGGAKEGGTVDSSRPGVIGGVKGGVDSCLLRENSARCVYELS